jgi:hypothetical protein
MLAILDDEEVFSRQVTIRFPFPKPDAVLRLHQEGESLLTVQPALQLIAKLVIAAALEIFWFAGVTDSTGGGFSKPLVHTLKQLVVLVVRGVLIPAMYWLILVG